MEEHDLGLCNHAVDGVALRSCFTRPVLQTVFGIVPLNWDEWQIVVGWSAPIILIDEALKYVERGWFMAKATPALKAKKID